MPRQQVPLDSVLTYHCPRNARKECCPYRPSVSLLASETTKSNEPDGCVHDPRSLRHVGNISAKDDTPTRTPHLADHPLHQLNEQSEHALVEHEEVHTLLFPEPMRPTVKRFSHEYIKEVIVCFTDGNKRSTGNLHLDVVECEWARSDAFH
jgi:hypothetical protein